MLAYKDRSERARGLRERSSLTLEDICGLEPGLAYEGLAHTLAIVCLSQAVMLGFDSRRPCAPGTPGSATRSARVSDAGQAAQGTACVPKGPWGLTTHCRAGTRPSAQCPRSAFRPGGAQQR